MGCTDNTVVLICSELYVKAAAVALRTLSENATAPVSVCLLTELVGAQAVENLKQCVVGDFVSLTVRDITISLGQMLSGWCRGRHPRVAYARWLLAELMPEAHRVLYLDCDIAVTGDLQSVFKTDMLGAECVMFKGSGQGAMLMNLDALRSLKRLAGPTKILRRMAHRGLFRWVPLCVFGKHCRTVPIRLSLIHWQGDLKPWQLEEVPGERRYFETLAETPFASDILFFSVYFYNTPIFRTETLLPIQAGAEQAKIRLDMLADNTGEHISQKNARYGELTAMYWAWKNYLPKHPELRYVGSCHYRRYFIFPQRPEEENLRRKLPVKSFVKRFRWHFSADAIRGHLHDCDVLLCMPLILPASLGSLFGHLRRVGAIKVCDWELVERLVVEMHPEYAPYVKPAMREKASGYFCLNYLMRRDLFEEFMEWAFGLLGEFERRSDWSGYTDYFNVRVPAYMLEYFINLWLTYQVAERGIRIRHRQVCVLTCLKAAGGSLFRRLRALMHRYL